MRFPSEPSLGSLSIFYCCKKYVRKSKHFRELGQGEKIGHLALGAGYRRFKSSRPDRLYPSVTCFMIRFLCGFFRRGTKWGTKSAVFEKYNKRPLQLRKEPDLNNQDRIFKISDGHVASRSAPESRSSSLVP